MSQSSIRLSKMVFYFLFMIYHSESLTEKMLQKEFPTLFSKLQKHVLYLYVFYKFQSFVYYRQRLSLEEEATEICNRDRDNL